MIITIIIQKEISRKLKIMRGINPMSIGFTYLFSSNADINYFVVLRNIFVITDLLENSELFRIDKLIEPRQNKIS